MVTPIPLLLGLLPGTALQDYLKKPEADYGYRVVQESRGLTEISLTSQRWQGKPWKHSLVVVTPDNVDKPDTAILYVTGDRVESQDIPFIKKFAEQARMPVITLFDVPNQPLFEAREDALIAITFGKYLETGDPNWPLLFPMTKSAKKAMDAIQSWSKGAISKFVVTGASKRGWTTWLVGASQDKRVLGIAPMVFDMLDMPRQLAYQRQSWGRYSDEINDYVQTGLVDVLKTPRGKEILSMVDPYSYLHKMTLPTLVVVGTNDRYWALDAHRLYWDRIRGPKLMRAVPNVGHNLGGGADAARSIAFFARCLSGAIPGGLPRPEGQDVRRRKVVPWYAGSSTLDFHESRWTPLVLPTGKPKKTASFREFVFQSGGLQASFTSVVTIRK